MPGFTFPRAGPLGLGSPPSRPALTIHSGHRYYVQLRLPHAHLGSLRITLAHRYLACPLSLCPRSCGLADRTGAYRLGAGVLGQPVPLIFRHSLSNETYGSPKFPSYPYGYMPRSRTPVVSRRHRHSAFTTAAFRSSRRRRLSPATAGLSYRPQQSAISGLSHAACTLATPGFAPPIAGTHAGSLPACRLSFGRVGLAPYRRSPTGQQQPISWNHLQSQGLGLTLARLEKAVSYQQSAFSYCGPWTYTDPSVHLAGECNKSSRGNLTRCRPKG